MLYARLIPDSTVIETVLDLDQSYVAALASSKQEWLRPIAVDPQPAVGPSQMLTDGGYVVEAEQVRQTWAVRDKTPDELRVIVTPRQIRQALTAAGLRAQIEAGVAAADQDTRDWWEFATSFESDHPMVLTMCSALGISDEQRGQVFQLAATL